MRAGLNAPGRLHDGLVRVAMHMDIRPDMAAVALVGVFRRRSGARCQAGGLAPVLQAVAPCGAQRAPMARQR